MKRPAAESVKATAKRVKASPSLTAASLASETSATSSSHFKAPLQPAAVNQLSNILQKRLEFARIKVENGWTNKTIVDIEALLPSPTQNPNPISIASTTTPASLTAPRYPASLATAPRRRPAPPHLQGQVTLGLERFPSGVDFPASPPALYQ